MATASAQALKAWPAVHRSSTESIDPIGCSRNFELGHNTKVAAASQPQNRSAFSLSNALTTSPLAVTTSAENEVVAR